LGLSSIKGGFWLQVNQENESDANGSKFLNDAIDFG
jgi:hypothetical protein